MHVPVNGNCAFNATHVISSTATSVPTAFDLTAFTTAGGGAQRDINTNAQQDLPRRQHLSLFGTVTGFFTPTSGR